MLCCHYFKQHWYVDYENEYSDDGEDEEDEKDKKCKAANGVAHKKGDSNPEGSESDEEWRNHVLGQKISVWA